MVPQICREPKRWRQGLQGTERGSFHQGFVRDFVGFVRGSWGAMSGLYAGIGGGQKSWQ